MKLNFLKFLNSFNSKSVGYDIDPNLETMTNIDVILDPFNDPNIPEISAPARPGFRPPVNPGPRPGPVPGGNEGGGDSGACGTGGSGDGGTTQPGSSEGGD